MSEQQNINNKNELISSHRFGGLPTHIIIEWSNGNFSITKSTLKDKNKGWKNKDNIEKTTLLNFHYNEIFLVLELLDLKKTIGNFAFGFEINDNQTNKIIITKKYTKDGKEKYKTYEMTVNEYYIIKTLIKRVIDIVYKIIYV